MQSLENREWPFQSVNQRRLFILQRGQLIGKLQPDYKAIQIQEYKLITSRADSPENPLRYQRNSYSISSIPKLRIFIT
jgi:hypothetical protein